MVEQVSGTPLQLNKNLTGLKSPNQSFIGSPVSLYVHVTRRTYCKVTYA